MTTIGIWAILTLALKATALAIPSDVSTRQSSVNSIFFNVGQSYGDEWQAFASAIKKPAGISLYGDIYSGALNSDSQNLLATYAQSNTGNVEIGFSWKDAATSNGYTQYNSAQLNHDIASGKFDNQLHAFAAYLATYPNVHYFLRIEYEVSQNLFANTNPSTFDSSTFDNSAYPAAYAYVRSIIAASVPNVSYVYHSVRDPVSTKALYPGDDAVDHIGFSIFNNDVCLPSGSTTNCEGQRIDPNLQECIDWAPKPKIVAESAPQPPASGDSASFIDYLGRVKDAVEQNGFVGWTYINSLWTAHRWDPSVWGDSRIESNPAVEAWFETNVANNPKYTFG